MNPVWDWSAKVGTKIFWSPEFFDRDYGQKVDVWAMGVIMYGLASGRFPFRDENDVRPAATFLFGRSPALCFQEQRGANSQTRAPGLRGDLHLSKRFFLWSRHIGQ